MNAFSSLKRMPAPCALAAALAVLASTTAHPALAACGFYYRAATPTQWVVPDRESGRLLEAVYRPAAGRFIRAGFETSVPHSGIAGLWKIAMVSDGIPPNPVPKGVTVDFGTVQWHDDGTEIMISGGRPPSTGDVCMGVWEQVGPFTYRLKHLALAWVSSDTPPSAGGPGPSPAQFLGPAIIRQMVTLAQSRDTYQGGFTLDQYNANESAVLVHISGTITGTRVAVD